ncbi:hypothetical protein [Actinomadura sp. DC4]|uniref:hypothetical protein n=1 Tax=Actinomadura sp. DC4 TaxID=3055069 RepID=UPI0025B1766B|nr:hypothetical protein [Actinomadura sp. DC4]MDN3357301.1 hypothetical protein [Actinomadura sp. DC4]
MADLHPQRRGRRLTQRKDSGPVDLRVEVDRVIERLPDAGRDGDPAADQAGREATDPDQPGSRVRAVGDAAQELVGALQWRGDSVPDPDAAWMVSEHTDQGHQNDFARWIRDSGGVPDEDSTMSSGEALLFSAYQAGLVDKSWLVAIHERAAAAEQVSDSFRRRGAEASTSTAAYGISMEKPYMA